MASPDSPLLAAHLRISAGVACLVAVAPAVPPTVRDPVLALALVAWTVPALGTLTRMWLRAWRNEDDPGAGRYLFVLGSGALLLVLVALLQPFLLRSLAGYEHLTWNVDWRYALASTRGVLRTGGVASALDYAGAGVPYHVGPAWLAASAARILRVSPDAVLFGLIPLVAGATVLVAGLGCLRRAGVGRRTAVFVLGSALWLPAPGLVRLFREAPGSAIHAESWFLTPSLMLNGLLGLSLGVPAVMLVLGRRTGPASRVLAALGLAAVFQIKPQYFIALGLFTGLWSLWLLVREGRYGGAPLAAALLALVMAVVGRTALPGLPEVFTGVAFDPGGVIGYWRLREVELSGVHVPLVALAALALLVAARAADRVPAVALRLAAAAAAIGVAYGLVLGAGIFFPLDVDPELAARSRLRGTESLYLTWNLTLYLQVLDPLKLGLRLGAWAPLVVLALSARRLTRHGPLRAAIAAIALLPATLGAAYVVAGFHSPETGYEAASDPGLHHVLERIPRDGELVIASDLADAAEDFARPLIAPELTSRGHRFWLSNLRYLHWMRPDAEERLRELRAFFGAEWTEWHSSWLARIGVTHVLVRDRCRPVWWGKPGAPLQPVAERGGWHLLRVEEDARPAGPTPRPTPERVEPGRGQAGCLDAEAGAPRDVEPRARARGRGARLGRTLGRSFTRRS